MNEIPRNRDENNNVSPESDDPFLPLAEAEPIVERVREIQTASIPKERFGFSPRFGYITGRLRSYRRGEETKSEQIIARELGQLAAQDSIDDPRTA